MLGLWERRSLEPSLQVSGSSQQHQKQHGGRKGKFGKDFKELFCENGSQYGVFSPTLENSKIFLLKVDYGEGYGSEFDEQEAAERCVYKSLVYKSRLHVSIEIYLCDIRVYLY